MHTPQRNTPERRQMLAARRERQNMRDMARAAAHIRRRQWFQAWGGITTLAKKLANVSAR